MIDIPKVIVITGASSGLGKALAEEYAAPGVTLHLSARDERRLEETAESCRLKMAMVHTEIVDVTSSKQMNFWLDNICQNDAIDLIIANAGISGGTAGGVESDDQTRKIFNTNVNGTLNTLLPIIKHMEKNKRGQIGIISSLAGYRGLPSAPAYSASKGAMKLYGEGLRGVMAKYGVGVSVITPGYIKTPITDANNFPMPFMVSAEEAARTIRERLKYNPSRITFPFALGFLVWLVSCLSPTITDPVFSRLPSKGKLDVNA